MSHDACWPPWILKRHIDRVMAPRPLGRIQRHILI